MTGDMAGRRVRDDASSGAVRPVRVTVGATLEDLLLVDVSGREIRVPADDGWTLLGLMRSVGCPVCTLRHHELVGRGSELTAAGVQVVSVVPSSIDEIRRAVPSPPELPRLVADPGASLLERFGAARSARAVARGLFHGLVAAELRGLRLRADDAPAETGDWRQLGADVLVGPDGVVASARYWRWPGDHLPIEDVLSTVRHDEAS